MQADMAKPREDGEAAEAPDPIIAQGRLSRSRLLAREFDKSLEASERALQLAPRMLWIAANRAHALMFLGRAKEAREAYLEQKGQRLRTGSLWRTMF